MIEQFILAIVYTSGMSLFLPIGEGGGGLIQRLTVALGLSIGVMHQIAPSDVTLPTVTLTFMAGVVATSVLVFILYAMTSLCEILEGIRGMNMGSTIDPHFETTESSLSLIARSALLAYCGVTGILSEFLALAMKYGGVITEVRLEIKELFEGVSLYIEAFLQFTLMVSPLIMFFLMVECTAISITKLLPTLSLTAETFILKSLLYGGFIYVLSMTSLHGFFEGMLLTHHSFHH